MTGSWYVWGVFFWGIIISGIAAKLIWEYRNHRVEQ